MKNIAGIHPLLFALYPVTFLFGHNIENAVSPTDAFLSALVIISLTSLLLLFAGFIVKDRQKAFILVSIFLIFFFSYGHMKAFVESRNTDNFMFVWQHRYALPAWGLSYIFIFLKIKKYEGDPHILSRALTMSAGFLVFASLGGALPRLFESSVSHRHKNPAAGEDSLSSQTDPGSLPDIYYIVLDEYAGLKQIKENYGYDNSGFADSLVKKGFYVAAESRTRYGGSAKSISASLNMEYPPEDSSEAEIARIVQKNKAARILKSQGYKHINFGSWCSVTRYNKYADLNFSGFFFLNEFTVLLIQSSMLAPILDSGIFFRKALLDVFEKLGEMPKIRGPKFIFAHILSPHEPFIFDRDGHRLLMKDRTWKNKAAYLEQYIFVTRKIEAVVDKILRESESPPVIVIQSDHGVRRREGLDFGDFREIFNAYYLPSGGDRLLYQDISPVNTFRLIFNHYFHADYVFLGNQQSQ